MIQFRNLKINKKCFAFIFLLGCVFTFVNAQSEIQNLDIKIMPAKLDVNIPSIYRAKVNRKVVDIFTKNGVVNKKGSTFAVYPMLNIVEFDKIEGIKVLQTVQMEMSFLVKNIFSKEDFIVFSKNINGAGNDRQTAINKAIMSIRPQQKIYNEFIKGISEKANSYYSENCNSIVTNVQKALDRNDYEKAITLLNVLPNDSECRKSNESLLTQAYQKYQTKNCKDILRRANIEAVKKEYKTAIDLIALVDAESPCAADAKQALQKISSASDEQTAKKLAFMNKVYSDNKEIQKARQQNLNAISNTYIEGINKE